MADSQVAAGVIVESGTTVAIVVPAEIVVATVVRGVIAARAATGRDASPGSLHF